MFIFLKLFFFLLFVFLFADVSADFKIVEVLPNTSDDTNLESIKIQNTGSGALSLSGFILSDFKKEYVIPLGDSIPSGESRVFLRSETKLVLNNTNESIFLHSPEYSLIDSIQYKASIKGEILYFGETLQESIGEAILVENNIVESGSRKIVELKPEVLFQLQRPSYITQSGSSNTYICDSDRDECKVNFNFESSFSEKFNKSEHICEIDFGGVGETQQQKCNPNTIIFPEGVTTVYITILSKTSRVLVADKKIEIIFDRSLPTFKEITEQSKTAKISIRKPRITVQSGLEGRATNFYCKKQPCKFNLEYKKGHPDEACFWDFGPGTSPSMTTRERCNPGFIDIPEGSFVLQLRVYEKGFHQNQKTLKYFIHNIPEEVIEIEEKQKTIVEEVTPLDIENEVIANEVIAFEGKEEPIVQDIPALITLQGKIGKEKTLSGQVLDCSQVERCYVNFLGEYGGDGLYSWLLDGEEFSSKINPAGIWVNSGNHRVELRVLGKENKIISSSDFIIRVTPDSQSEISLAIDNEPELFTSKKIEKDTQIKKKLDFTQNFLVLKYDGLRISGKAPVGSSIEIYSSGSLVGKQQVSEKGKYRIVSKQISTGKYNFDTKIILESQEEIYMEDSGVSTVKSEDRTYWFISKKSSSRKSSTTKTKVLPKLVVKDYEKVEEQPESTMSIQGKILITGGIFFISIGMLIHILTVLMRKSQTSILGLYSQRFLTRQHINLILG